MDIDSVKLPLVIAETASEMLTDLLQFSVNGLLVNVALGSQGRSMGLKFVELGRPIKLL